MNDHPTQNVKSLLNSVGYNTPLTLRPELALELMAHAGLVAIEAANLDYPETQFVLPQHVGAQVLTVLFGVALLGGRQAGKASAEQLLSAALNVCRTLMTDEEFERMRAAELTADVARIERVVLTRVVDTGGKKVRETRERAVKPDTKTRGR